MTTRRQKDALREQRSLGERLSVWREGRADAARTREAERRKADQARPRGVDRVPEQLRTRVEPVTLVEHDHPTYRMRRARKNYLGGPLATGKNRPHVNPGRDRRLAGKARRRARRADR